MITLTLLAGDEGGSSFNFSSFFLGSRTTLHSQFDVASSSSLPCHCLVASGNSLSPSCWRTTHGQQASGTTRCGRMEGKLGGWVMSGQSAEQQQWLKVSHFFHCHRYHVKLWAKEARDGSSSNGSVYVKMGCYSLSTVTEEKRDLSLQTAKLASFEGGGPLAIQ